MNSYYYNLLNKEQQKAYYAIKEGILNLKDSFPVPMMSNKEYGDIYFMVRLDNPQIFYTVKFSYRYYPDSNYVEMMPEYIMSKDKIREHKKALEARVKKIARGASELSPKEQELYIHDFLVENVKYDKLKKEYSHEIIGSLSNGVAVCEGIAKGVKAICDELGIWCIVAISKENPEKGVKYRHAWNIIKIDGKYYHLDATFDNTLTKDEVIRYDYVNLSDKQIYRDHEEVVWKVPECTDGDNFYYKVKKISWTTIEEVRKRAKQAVKKNKKLLFHWRGGYLTKDVLQDIMRAIDEEARIKEKQAMVSLNFAQAVIKVSFKDGIGKQIIDLEEANEGEVETQ